MHLALFYKKPRMIQTLRSMGVDLTLKNSFGEACDEKFEAFCNSYQNIIWLDMEFTHGHYEGTQGGAHSGETPHILEAAVVVTDKYLKELGRGHWVIGGFSKEYLEGLGRFHQMHFRDKIPGGAFPPLDDTRPGNGLFFRHPGFTNNSGNDRTCYFEIGQGTLPRTSVPTCWQ